MPKFWPKTIPCPHPGCEYLFSKPVHLRRHLLSHSDVPIWRCPSCGQVFKRMDSFQRHKRRMHPDLPTLKAVKIGAPDAVDTSIKSEDEADPDADDHNQDLEVSFQSVRSNPLKRPSASSDGAHHLNPYDPTITSSPSANTNNKSHHYHHHHHHHHPYSRNDSASHSAAVAASAATTAPPITSASDSSGLSHNPWPSQTNQSQMYDSGTPTTSAAATSMSFYPNLYGAPISYNDYASTSSSAINPSVGYADQAAPLSIASLTAPSPSWGSSASDTENQNFFDDILQSILMDSISTFVPHEPMPPVDFQTMGGASISNDAFAFGEQTAQSVHAAQPIQAEQQQQQQQQPQQQQPQTQQSQMQQSQAQSQLPNVLPSQQQQQQSQQQQQPQTQDAQMAASMPSQTAPQPLANLVPFATFTNSAYNSGRSTPGTPRLPHTHAGNMDESDEMTRSVEKVGDQAATNIGARTRDLVLHGVNIPKKPPRLTAASLFSAATRHTRSMLPLLPSYWLLDHRRLAAERPYVFISLLAIGTLWQPRADVKAYGAELWQLIFRSIWAGAVFYLDQPQLMREATAVMAFTHLYAFLCKDESIRRKSIHSTYTGSSLGREYGWRQGIWFLIGPWEESLQRLLGPNIQMALVELEVLARDQTTNKLSAEQKSLVERLHGVWKQWSDAEEVNRNMICHSITESHHSEFLSNYSQMRNMSRIACQALVPCADDVWDAKTAIEWAKLVLEYKSTRESNDRSLLAGKKQLGPILDALFGIDAPSPATAKTSEGGKSKEDNEKAKQQLERRLCFTIKEHFALQSLLEGLHLMWIARYTPPFRTGTSYAADFSPAQASFAPGLESAFCIRGGVAYHKLNVLDAEMMMAALSRWMRLFHQSYLPNPIANSTGFSRASGSNGSAHSAKNGKGKADAGASASASVAAKTRVTTLGPNNDRFQLHFRFHVIQLSALFNAHHVVHALVSTCGELTNAEENGSNHTNGAKSEPTRGGIQKAIPLRCESCVDPDSCPYRNPRLQRWAAVHAGTVIGNFMSMPRLSTLTPTILEGLGQAFGTLVILCRIQRSAAQRRRPQCKCAPEVREASLELISDQCLHLDADRPSPGEKENEMAQARFETANECWLQHGTLDEGATLLGQPIQDWPFVLQDMGNELKSVAGTWQTAEKFLGTAQKMLNSFTFYVD